jgi:hypothetical protein
VGDSSTRLARYQQAGRWCPVAGRALADLRVLIIGMDG